MQIFLMVDCSVEELADTGQHLGPRPAVVELVVEAFEADQLGVLTLSLHR